MTWTTDLPTAPGYYWIKPTLYIGRPEIVEVGLDLLNESLEIRGFDEPTPLQWAVDHGMIWSGPILPPADGAE